MADVIRVQIDLAFPCDDKGGVAPEVKAAHNALIDSIAKARSVAVKVTPMEDTQAAKRHVCRHADGLPCVESEDVKEGAACVAAARAK